MQSPKTTSSLVSNKPRKSWFAYIVQKGFDEFNAIKLEGFRSSISLSKYNCLSKTIDEIAESKNKLRANYFDLLRKSTEIMFVIGENLETECQTNPKMPKFLVVCCEKIHEFYKNVQNPEYPLETAEEENIVNALIDVLKEVENITVKCLYNFNKDYMYKRLPDRKRENKEMSSKNETDVDDINNRFKNLELLN